MKYWQEGDFTVSIKDPQEIKIMRESGVILGYVLSQLEKSVQPGISTKELDNIAEELIRKNHAKPTFKGYQGFPGSICASVNDEVVHGIPSQRILKEGDIITIDCGVTLKNLITDSAITVGVGKISDDAQKFINTNYKVLDKVIKTIKPGQRTNQISKFIGKFVTGAGYNVVKELSGHGVGTELHEDPYILNFDNGELGPVMKPGMTLAIEPIITMGKSTIKTLNDHWTIVTKDGSLSSQVEHTVLITEQGAEILTTRPK